MEMGPSGFLLKPLVTTHLDIRSYSSHAPPQGIKTNSKYKYKVKHEGKDKDICKNAKTKTSAKKCEDKGRRLSEFLAIAHDQVVLFKERSNMSK